ncbi:MAG: DNA recombination protein RmuC [Candidatus Omnitrophica bacterium]|nr:DNA recombination protein RmuC [Candidatus Omnitrophota bacterium]
MNDLFGILLFGGGVCAGLLATGTFLRRRQRDYTALQAQAASAGAVQDELRRQITAAEQERELLRRDLAAAQQEKNIAQTRWEQAQVALGEQRQLLELADERLRATFQALSGESLKSNSQAFISQAKQTFEHILLQAQGNLNEKEHSMKTIVSALDETLKRYERQIADLERKRAADYGSLEQQIRALLSTNQQLQKETGNLVSALRRPEVRGRWGEVTLRRVVELAGMVEHCDFTEQAGAVTEQGRTVRPDLIVHLPGRREIVIDSKIALDAYLDAAAADDEPRRQAGIAKHAQQLRRHMKNLAGKSYWEQFPQAPEFVVMFIPGDSFLSVAVSVDPSLIEDAMAERVIIATPTTLIALLRAVAFGWRQESIAQHAQEIAALGKEVYERFQPFVEHLNSTGNHLGKATEAFNRAVTSLERRVLVSVRKFRELGATGERELPEATVVEQLPLPGDFFKSD